VVLAPHGGTWCWVGLGMGVNLLTPVSTNKPGVTIIMCDLVSPGVLYAEVGSRAETISQSTGNYQTFDLFQLLLGSDHWFGQNEAIWEN